MSAMVLDQVKQLSGNLSTSEKAQMIEWLSVSLQQELTGAGVAIAVATHRADQSNGAAAYQNGTPTRAAATDEALAETSLEERPWTEEEIRELMRPKPKTGAEIAAMIESGEVDTSVWAEMDIPDVVEWLQNLRHQERIQRGLDE